MASNNPVTGEGSVLGTILGGTTEKEQQGEQQAPRPSVPPPEKKERGPLKPKKKLIIEGSGQEETVSVSSDQIIINGVPRSRSRTTITRTSGGKTTTTSIVEETKQDIQFREGTPESVKTQILKNPKNPDISQRKVLVEPRTSGLSRDSVVRDLPIGREVSRFEAGVALSGAMEAGKRGEGLGLSLTEKDFQESQRRLREAREGVPPQVKRDTKFIELIPFFGTSAGVRRERELEKAIREEKIGLIESLATGQGQGTRIDFAPFVKAKEEERRTIEELNKARTRKSIRRGGEIVVTELVGAASFKFFEKIGQVTILSKFKGFPKSGVKVQEILSSKPIVYGGSALTTGFVVTEGEEKKRAFREAKGLEEKTRAGEDIVFFGGQLLSFNFGFKAAEKGGIRAARFEKRLADLEKKNVEKGKDFLTGKFVKSSRIDERLIGDRNVIELEEVRQKSLLETSEIGEVGGSRTYQFTDKDIDIIDVFQQRASRISKQEVEDLLKLRDLSVTERLELENLRSEIILKRQLADRGRQTSFNEFGRKDIVVKGSKSDPTTRLTERFYESKVFKQPKFERTPPQVLVETETQTKIEVLKGIKKPETFSVLKREERSLPTGELTQIRIKSEKVLLYPEIKEPIIPKNKKSRFKAFLKDKEGRLKLENILESERVFSTENIYSKSQVRSRIRNIEFKESLSSQPDIIEIDLRPKRVIFGILGTNVDMEQDIGLNLEQNLDISQKQDLRLLKISETKQISETSEDLGTLQRQQKRQQQETIKPQLLTPFLKFPSPPNFPRSSTKPPVSPSLIIPSFPKRPPSISVPYGSPFKFKIFIEEKKKKPKSRKFKKFFVGDLATQFLGVKGVRKTKNITGLELRGGRK